MTEPQPPPPQYSPDGRWYWDGRQWILVAPAPPPVEQALMRRLDFEFEVGEVERQAMTNLIKHGQAQHATVAVSIVDDRLLVEVTDDGRGGARLSPGGGLSGLADRVAALDGQLAVDSPAGGPTRVRAELPCES